jgi:hypothetical protein
MLDCVRKSEFSCKFVSRFCLSLRLPTCPTQLPQSWPLADFVCCRSDAQIITPSHALCSWSDKLKILYNRNTSTKPLAKYKKDFHSPLSSEPTLVTAMLIHSIFRKVLSKYLAEKICTKRGHQRDLYSYKSGEVIPITVLTPIFDRIVVESTQIQGDIT